MKQNNKKLYESIMASVAKEVKKVLNENSFLDNVEPVPGAKGDDVAHQLSKFLMNYNASEELLKDLINITNNPNEYRTFGQCLRNYIKRYNEVLR